MVLRKIIGIIFVILLGSVPTLAADMTLRLFDKEKYNDVKISDVQKIRVSANCIKNGKPSCEAWKVLLGKPKPISASKIPLAGNPAAKYCWDVGAKNRILKSADNKQYDYCVFADNSMIDSWDLYYRHFPPPPPIK